MSALFLRLLAVVLMITDHTAFALSGCIPPVWLYVLRGVGRCAFPIFAFLIANGYRHTRSCVAYSLRLLVFAFISEPFFDTFLIGRPVFWNNQNVFFTLFLGLAAIMGFEKLQSLRYGKITGLAVILICISLGDVLKTDYGTFGVAFIVLLHFAGENKAGLSFAVVAFALRAVVIHITKYVCSGIPFLSGFVSSPPASPVPGGWDMIAAAATAALLPLLLYNGKKGKSPNGIAGAITKYSFYAIYPIHLFILSFV